MDCKSSLENTTSSRKVHLTCCAAGHSRKGECPLTPDLLSWMRLCIGVTVSQRRARCVEKSLGIQNNCSAADAHYVFAVQHNLKGIEPCCAATVHNRGRTRSRFLARMTPANDNGTCDFDVGRGLREGVQRYFCSGG